MKRHRINYMGNTVSTSSIFLAALTATLFLGTSLSAVELPPESPLWENGSPEHPIRLEAEEQVRFHKVQSGSPSGRNRAYSSVSSPTYCIHRPEKPNGVGLVICPGGGFRDVWIDREGHDLALLLKAQNVTCLVLKYRTRPQVTKSAKMWQDYQLAVQADGRQAVRTLRMKARELGLQTNKIGICGFSAGGHLSISCSLMPDPHASDRDVSGIPDFVGLFYPGIPDGIDRVLANRTSSSPAVGPFFIVNAQDDTITPTEKCIAFYADLLRAGVNAEIHVFSRGSHGFGLGGGRGESTAFWPTSFTAWLRDASIVPE